MIKINNKVTSYSDLATILDKYKIICLDLFDTLYYRIDPVTGNRVTYYAPIEDAWGSLADKRKQVGREVRKVDPYYSLKDVAVQVVDDYVPYMQREIKADAKYLRPTELSQWIAQYLDNRYKPAYILTDTYYSHDIIRTIISAKTPALYNHLAGILVSSTDKCAKIDGTMYKTVLNFNSVSPSEVVMLSDMETDLQSARTMGIDGLLVQII